MFWTGGIPAVPSKWLGPSQIEARVKTTVATNFLPFSWMVNTACLLDGGQTGLHSVLHIYSSWDIIDSLARNSLSKQWLCCLCCLAGHMILASQQSLVGHKLICSWQKLVEFGTSMLFNIISYYCYDSGYVSKSSSSKPLYVKIIMNWCCLFLWNIIEIFLQC